MGKVQITPENRFIAANMKHRLYRNAIKRLLDVLLVSIVFLFFWWLFAIIAMLVKINMGSPILYQSERLGKGDKPILLYKFRTMTNELDADGILLPGPQRLTKFGRILRSTSLDELPSLLNILKGELSFVGPRPLLMKYLPYFYEHERIRHSVRPGLTGWAQVNGRNSVSWDKRFEMDVDYVERMSLPLDIKIMFLTVYKVLKRSDIIQDNQQTDSLYIVRGDMVAPDVAGQNYTSGESTFTHLTL